ncbi:hypothetical protein [uncultured Anaerotruncus sp.]|uniref:hypothetical protein n=1 Tax=uncultured Anaerotruncus sp. TaxID=905011 RepID=UPI002671D1BE|nr:hypothetical protein [uncultured Anaerotruncus sp.]
MRVIGRGAAEKTARGRLSFDMGEAQPQLLRERKDDFIAEQGGQRGEYLYQKSSHSGSFLKTGSIELLSVYGRFVALVWKNRQQFEKKR